MEHGYDIHDLVTARMNAVRFAGKDPDLAKFHSKRYHALQFALTASLPFPAGTDAQALEILARRCIESSASLESPFAGFLEAPQCVIDLYGRFQSDQYDAFHREDLEPTRAAIKKLLDGVELELHRILGDRTVSDDDLCRYGFDPSTPWPDERATD
jgi:hypothetical protein